MRPVITDGDLKVLEVSIVFKHIWHIWGYVENVVNSIFLQLAQVRRVFGISQVQVRQYLHREGGQVGGIFQVTRALAGSIG